MNRTHLTLTAAALVATALVASGCCGGACDAAQSPESRTQFVRDYNSKNTGCTLAGSGDHLELDMTCSKKVEQVKKEVSAGCVGFKLVGVETVKLKGSDGTASCNVQSCTCQ